MFGERGGFLIFILAFVSGIFLFSSGMVSATGFTITTINSTDSQISVTDASNLYAYEINLDYTGSMGGAVFSEFLGGSTTTGTNDDTTNKIYSVYESRLDSGQTGISGNGVLFNVSYDGSVDRRFALFIASDGSEEYVYYNGSADGGGGGGGGGGGASSLPQILVVPDELNLKLIQGETGKAELAVANLLESEASFAISVTSELEGVVSLPDSLVLGSLEQKTIDIEIAGLDKSVAGKILFNSGVNLVASVPLLIDVRSENFLFDVDISLSPQFKTIFEGQMLSAQIDLLQVGPDQKVDVTANYIVKDFDGNVYLQESETFFVLGQKQVTIEVDTSDLAIGDYVLLTEIVYPDAFATSSVSFRVLERKIPVALIIIVLIVVAIAIVIFSVLRYRKIKKRVLE